MELSVYDLSKHLGVATSTIERWLRQGKLPVSRKGAKIKFHVKELENWASKHNLILNISQEQTSSDQKSTSVISLSNAVKNGGVYAGISGNSPQEVLADALAKAQNIPQAHREELLAKLMEREAALSTGIGSGIAIPHPREQVDFIDSPMAIVCYLKEAVDYNALDNQPVLYLFILLCPDLKMHLKLLSSLSYCLRDPNFSTFLETQPSMEDLADKIDTLLKDNPLL